MNAKSEPKKRKCGPFKNPFPARAGALLLSLAALVLALPGPARAQAPPATIPFSDADWVSLSLGIGGTNYNSWVHALAASGTNLYAAGMFTNAGGVLANNIAKWNGTAWSPLGSGLSGERNGGPFVNALAVSGTNLYAGGCFTNAGGVSANCIAQWDGHAWSALGSGFSNSLPYTIVNALAVSGTNLYAGGIFDTAGGVPANNIAQWDGSAWSALGSGMDSQVIALAVSGTNLYAGGVFTTAGWASANNIAQWDGSAWSALGSGITVNPLPYELFVFALAVSGTNLYVGGSFDAAGGVSATNIAKWDGSTWSALGSGFSGGPVPCVDALTMSGGNIYAGGLFTNAAGVLAKNIAEWNGSAWLALGSGMSGEINGGPFVAALAADGAGHLFVGGGFSMAGTNVVNDIAQANVGIAPIVLWPPQSQTAEIGATVDFTVDVTANPAVTYQWFFNGTNPVSCGPFGCLELTNVNASLDGAYTVVVTNVYGAVTSATAMLDVIPVVPRRPVPAVQVGGAAGSLLNVDYVNSFAPVLSWTALGSVSLTSTLQWYFDVSVPLAPQRFYRAWQLGTPTVVPSLQVPGLVPAIALTGNVGESLRLDYINQVGPTNAWVTLGTTTLTNTSQLYFDVSVIGQPPRLYRIVPLP